MTAKDVGADDRREPVASVLEGAAPAKVGEIESSRATPLSRRAELRSYRGLGGGNQLHVLYFDPAHPRNRAERRAAAKLMRGGRS